MKFNRKDLGVLFVLVAIILATLETHYFGNNLYPVTKEEHFCDGLSFVLFVFGSYLLVTRKRI